MTQAISLFGLDIDVVRAVDQHHWTCTYIRFATVHALNICLCRYWNCQHWFMYLGLLQSIGVSSQMIFFVHVHVVANSFFSSNNQYTSCNSFFLDSLISTSPKSKSNELYSCPSLYDNSDNIAIWWFCHFTQVRQQILLRGQQIAPAKACLSVIHDTFFGGLVMHS